MPSPPKTLRTILPSSSQAGLFAERRDSADTAPTTAELAVFADLSERLEAQLVEWREVLAKDVVALDDALRKNNVPLIAPAATPIMRIQPQH